MAFILRRNGEAVTGTVTLVQGNVLKLKLERVAKNVELRFVSTAPNVLVVDDVSHNTKSDTWFFSLVAKSLGSASLKIEATAPATIRFTPPASLQLTIEAPVSLPDENSVNGMLIRLFLLEAPSPDMQKKYSISAADAKTAMQYMRLVLENRLRSDNPGQFYAKGATNLIAIVRAPNQVAGFDNYPTLSKQLQQRINDIIETANDGTQRGRSAYLEFYQAALEVANGKVIADPCQTGLFAWKTTEAPAPGPRFQLFKAVAGNEFYTLKSAAK